MWVEYASRPLAIVVRRPRFSWVVSLPGRHRSQSAYQVLVATKPDLLSPGLADLWDSGRVASSQSVNVEYAGVDLRSNMDCSWCVKVWDESGNDHGFCVPEYFGVGLLDPSDWQATWIGMGGVDDPVSDPDAFQQGRVTPEVQAFEPDSRAPLLRKEFTVSHPVRRARAYVCGLGLFELHLNGEKVGDDVLSTPRSDFRKRVFYATYEVTSSLIAGENAVGLLLGNGWFNGQKKYWGWQMQWFGSPRAIVQIEVEYQDGAMDRILSDASWQGDWSPITFNCFFDGETVDTRLEQPGWDRAGFAATGWQRVKRLPAPGGTLVPIMHELEKPVETLRPVSVREPEPGVYVYDLGKNITGWVRLVINGGKAGDTVTLRYGEAQHENGALNASSNNRALQRDQFILGGAGISVLEPRFTFHGFQFVEVSGYPGIPDLDSLTGVFICTAVAQTGQFECGNALINRIHACTLQSQRCNVQMGVPTDDTQRPERQGWGTDAWATAHEALYNLWMPQVYAKWIGDFRDQQDELGMVGMIAPQAGSEEDLVWSAAFVLMPWWTYLHCGDLRLLEENYPALQRYMAFLRRVGVRTISTQTSTAVIDSLLWRCGKDARFPAESERGHLQISQWGDHLSTAEGFVARTNLPLSVATAFYYLDVMVMSRIADALGKPSDAAEYRQLAGAIQSAYHERFFDPHVGYYDSGVQSAQAWPLAFGMVPEEHQGRVAAYFTRCVGEVQRHLTTGYVGTKFAIEALSMLGRDDLVWQLATATGYPSWGYMLRNNRTTSCERWDGDGGSLNHAPLGAAIDEWFYWGLAGIRADEGGPGFEHIVFKPYIPKTLPWARATLQTIRGEIVSDWRHDGRQVTWVITVPANCKATIHVPADDPGKVMENGQPLAHADGVAFLGVENGRCRFSIGSGAYQMAFPSPFGNCA